MSKQNDDDVLRSMHRAAMQGLNESTSFRGGVKAVIEAVCTHLGWPGGEYWEVGADRGAVDRQTFWSSPELTDSPLVDPATEKEPLSLPLATGLPGAVWANDSEIWMATSPTSRAIRSEPNRPGSPG